MRNKGAVIALLDIYKNTLVHLKESIASVSTENLTKIIDVNTSDDNCRSLQTILAHVVNSGYSYAISIYNSKGNNEIRPAKLFHSEVTSFQHDLDKMFAYTVFVFEDIYDADLEIYEEVNKMKTGWGQYYDIEQLMEHAIVHVLRHQRQINTVLKNLDKINSI
jgi:hypothetical protein